MVTKNYANEELRSINLLIVGSPNNGGKPTKSIQDMLNDIPAKSLKGMQITAFDTRNPGFIAGLFSWAADRIAKQLVKTGGILKKKPTGFLVNGREGPLANGELERAAKWGKELVD